MVGIVKYIVSVQFYKSYVHSAVNPMYFEKTGHLGGVAEDDIPKIHWTFGRGH